MPHRSCVLAGLFACSLQAAEAATTPASCVAAVSASIPNWRYATPPPDAAAWAKDRRIDPVAAAGDFDGDGQTDWALLIVDGKATKLAICMHIKRSPRVFVIADPYCGDAVYRSNARSRHHNYETYRDEVIKRDGVSVSCFEKAGATYVYERGSFRRIVDAD
jgi:ABC-type antimicrobial peptide transport system ATPase subunit